MGIEGHALWCAIRLEASALKKTFGCGSESERFWDFDDGDGVIVFCDDMGADAEGWNSAISDKCREGSNNRVIRMKAGDGAIVFNAEIQSSALGVG